MTRATIKDIAAQSGLSTSTVDRTLNGRAGVSALNRYRVMQAAQRLGYPALLGTMPMPSRPVRIALLTPHLDRAFITLVAETISTQAAKNPLVSSCRIIPIRSLSSEDLQHAVDALADVEAVAVIAKDTPQNRETINGLVGAGVQVVTLATDLKGTTRAFYVGVDNHAAGRTAGRITSLLAAGKSGPVAVYAGSRAFLGHKQREDGFVNHLKAHPDLLVLPTVETQEDSTAMQSAVTSQLRRTPNLAAIYCVGAGRRGIIEALNGLRDRPVVVMHDLTDISRHWMETGKIDAIIDQNAQLVGEQAVQYMLGAIAGSRAAPGLKQVNPRLILLENLPKRNAP
ncbi:LacI family DNA-binding transcriptional regulator [Paracoccaceae bacterium]|jgi:LacI family transcriptional regulator|nr:LacI family DNA-binding transcriptional regulator [Paracoccaceae bacterium]